MKNVLKSMKLHIGILGKRNVGKSSLINFLTSQNVSIVSDIAGTTTDVVEKAMELIPIGPVVFLDTAGIDDSGELGIKRLQKTFDSLNRIDVGIIVCDYSGIDDFEISLISELNKRKTPFLILVNKNDKSMISEKELMKLQEYTDKIYPINTKDDSYKNKIIKMILDILPDGFFDNEIILDDIVSSGDTVVHVVPIDEESPRGRLILPQVRTIRNALDNNVISIVVKDTELKAALENMKKAPTIVVTDSQIFKQVSETVPKDIMLTSYSILFARLKGDLATYIAGVKTISGLKDSDKVLICESCTHPTSCDDIGRVKIPNLLKNFTNKNLEFVFCNGHDFPNNISEYALVIHCGGCMTNKKEILSRIILAKESNVPITNYGLVISYCTSIFDRVIYPFCR